MQQTPEGWYFDYCIECDLAIPESEREMFGGAPGFLVLLCNGDISILTWADRQSLGLSIL